jgi:hypothetical protein
MPLDLYAIAPLTAPQPSPPARQFSFTDFQTNNPTAPPPGDKLDSEYDRTNTTLTQALAWAQTSLNTDGTIRPGIVGTAQLVPGLWQSIADQITNDVQGSVDQAAASASSASTSKNAASASASAAQTQSQAASGSASTAQTAAGAAQNSVTSAQGSATTASNAATTASNAANTATGAKAVASDYAVLTQAWAEHMPDVIPPNILANMGVTGDHWSSRWWANQAADYIHNAIDGGATVTTSDIAPTLAADGDLWWDSVGGQLYVYYDDNNSRQWVVANNGGGGGRADVANILDYGGGNGGDDAAAFRAAVASGKNVVFVPPGTYTFKTTVSTGAPASNPACVLISAKSDLTVFAYGARFLIDNSISGPTPTTTVAFGNDCKHVTWLGGTLVGNNTGLSASAENVAFECNACTGLTIRDAKITGTFLTAFAGTWQFDCLIENVQGFNLTNPIDMAHLENVVFRRCVFFANPAHAVTGANIHYDTPTLSGNLVTTEAGVARALATGCTNRLYFLECLFHGFGTGIGIDCVKGALISRTVIRNGLVASSPYTQTGVLLYRGSAAVSAGLPTTDITIEDCDIYGNGVTAGGGAGSGVSVDVAQVSVLNSRIYDNTGSGITATSVGNVSGLVVSGCDFRSRSGGSLQSAAIAPALFGVVTAGGNATGAVRLNQGVVASGIDYLTIEGTSQNGVADADTKLAVLRLTSNQNAGGFGGGIEFGGRRANSGAGAQGSGYYASLKGALVDGSNNTLGTLDVYVRKLNSDVALTKVGSFNSSGLAMTVSLGVFGATPPAAKPAVTGSRGANAALASLITALASYGLVTDSTTA